MSVYGLKPIISTIENDENGNELEIDSKDKLTIRLDVMNTLVMGIIATGIINNDLYYSKKWIDNLKEDNNDAYISDAFQLIEYFYKCNYRKQFHEYEQIINGLPYLHIYKELEDKCIAFQKNAEKDGNPNQNMDWSFVVPQNDNNYAQFLKEISDRISSNRPDKITKLEKLFWDRYTKLIMTITKDYLSSVFKYDDKISSKSKRSLIIDNILIYVHVIALIWSVNDPADNINDRRPQNLIIKQLRKYMLTSNESLLCNIFISEILSKTSIIDYCESIKQILINQSPDRIKVEYINYATNQFHDEFLSLQKYHEGESSKQFIDILRETIIYMYISNLQSADPENIHMIDSTMHSAAKVLPSSQSYLKTILIEEYIKKYYSIKRSQDQLAKMYNNIIDWCHPDDLQATVRYSNLVKEFNDDPEEHLLLMDQLSESILQAKDYKLFVSHVRHRSKFFPRTADQLTYTRNVYLILLPHFPKYAYQLLDYMISLIKAETPPTIKSDIYMNEEIDNFLRGLSNEALTDKDYHSVLHYSKMRLRLQADPQLTADMKQSFKVIMDDKASTMDIRNTIAELTTDRQVMFDLQAKLYADMNQSDPNRIIETVKECTGKVSAQVIASHFAVRIKQDVITKNRTSYNPLLIFFYKQSVSLFERHARKRVLWQLCKESLDYAVDGGEIEPFLEVCKNIPEFEIRLHGRILLSMMRNNRLNYFEYWFNRLMKLKRRDDQKVEVINLLHKIIGKVWVQSLRLEHWRMLQRIFSQHDYHELVFWIEMIVMYRSNLDLNKMTPLYNWQRQHYNSKYSAVYQIAAFAKEEYDQSLTSLDGFTDPMSVSIKSYIYYLHSLESSMKQMYQITDPTPITDTISCALLTNVDHQLSSSNKNRLFAYIGKSKQEEINRFIKILKNLTLEPLSSIDPKKSIFYRDELTRLLWFLLKQYPQIRDPLPSQITDIMVVLRTPATHYCEMQDKINTNLDKDYQIKQLQEFMDSNPKNPYFYQDIINKYGRTFGIERQTTFLEAAYRKDLLEETDVNRIKTMFDSMYKWKDHDNRITALQIELIPNNELGKHIELIRDCVVKLQDDLLTRFKNHKDKLKIQDMITYDDLRCFYQINDMWELYIHAYYQLKLFFSPKEKLTFNDFSKQCKIVSLRLIHIIISYLYIETDRLHSQDENDIYQLYNKIMETIDSQNGSFAEVMDLYQYLCNKYHGLGPLKYSILPIEKTNRRIDLMVLHFIHNLLVDRIKIVPEMDMSFIPIKIETYNRNILNDFTSNMKI